MVKATERKRKKMAFPEYITEPKWNKLRTDRPTDRPTLIELSALLKNVLRDAFPYICIAL